MLVTPVLHMVYYQQLVMYMMMKPVLITCLVPFKLVMSTKIHVVVVSSIYAISNFISSYFYKQHTGMQVVVNNKPSENDMQVRWRMLDVFMVHPRTWTEYIETQMSVQVKLQLVLLALFNIIEMMFKLEMGHQITSHQHETSQTGEDPSDYGLYRLLRKCEE